MAKKLITHIDRKDSPSSKVDINALEASLGAFTTDSENRTVWIDGMPYGNAYISNNVNEDPIHSEVFNDFDRENGNKAFGDYSHAEGTGTKTYSKGSHAEGINTTAGLRGFSFAVIGERDNGGIQLWKSLLSSDGIIVSCDDEENPIIKEIKETYPLGSILSVLNGKVYTDCIEIISTQTRSGSEKALKLTDDYIRRGINPFADIFYEKNQYSNFLIWSANNPFVGKVDIGFAAHSEGMNTVAYGTNAHAEGTGTWAAESAHSEGVETGAYGVAAHAEGSNSIANANNAHAEGHSTFAAGHNSHTEGRKTVADGNQAHAEGIGTKAQGYNSHSEGNNTTAVSNSAHAEGIGTIAGNEVRGRGSHAEGIGTKTQNDGEHAEGRYNFTEHGIISSIGVGVDGTDTGRKNAITVNDAGQVFIASVNEIVGNVVNKYDPCTYDGHSVKAAGVKSLQRILTEAEKKQIPVTYAELLNLKENSLLIPGNYYQITDYVTSLHPILEDKAKSAGHKFDLIVTALSENEISENASCKSNNDILESNLKFSGGKVDSKTGDPIKLDVFTINNIKDNSSYPIYEKIGTFKPTTYDVNTANLTGLKNISGASEYVIIHGTYDDLNDSNNGNPFDKKRKTSFIYDFNNDIFCNDDISITSGQTIYIDQLNKHRFIECPSGAIKSNTVKTWETISSINISIPFTVKDETYSGVDFLYADLHYEIDLSKNTTATPSKTGSTISIYRQEQISNNWSTNMTPNNPGWTGVFNRPTDNSSQASTFAVNGWGNDDTLAGSTAKNEFEYWRPGTDRVDIWPDIGGGGGSYPVPTPPIEPTTAPTPPPKNDDTYELNLIWVRYSEDIDTYWESILSKLQIELVDNDTDTESDNNGTFKLSIITGNDSIGSTSNISKNNNGSIKPSDITSKDITIENDEPTFDSSGSSIIKIVTPSILNDGVDYSLKISNVTIGKELDTIDFNLLASSTNFIFIDDVDITNNKVVLKTSEYIEKNKEYYNNISTVYNLETTKVKYCHNNVEANNRFGTVVLGTNIKEHIEYAAYKDDDEGSIKKTPDELKNTLSYFSLGTLYSDNLMPPGADFRYAALSGFENEADFSKYTFRWDSCTTINDVGNYVSSIADDSKEKLNYHNDYCILTSSKDSLGKSDSTFFAVLCEKDTTEIINKNSSDIYDSASNMINIPEVCKNSSNFTQATLNIAKIGLNSSVVMSTARSLVNVPDLQYDEYGQDYKDLDEDTNLTHIKWVSNQYPSYYFETITTDKENDTQSTDISIYHTFGTQKYSLLGSEKNQFGEENYFEGVETHTFDNVGEDNIDQTIINRVKIIHTLNQDTSETIDYWVKLDNETQQPIKYNFHDRFNESILTTLLADKEITIKNEQLSSILGGDWYIYESIYKTLPWGSAGHGDNLVIENIDSNAKPYCNTESHKSVNDITNELESISGEDYSAYSYGKFYVVCKLTENKQLVEKITDSNNKEIPLAFLVKRDMKTTFNSNKGSVNPCLPVAFYDGEEVNNSPLTTKFNFNDYCNPGKGTTKPIPNVFLYENENYFYGLTSIPTNTGRVYLLVASEENYTGNLAGIQYETKLSNPLTLYFEDTAYSRYICEGNSEQSIIFNKDKNSNVTSSICKRVASLSSISNYYTTNSEEIGQLPVHLYTYLKKVRDIGTSTIYASSIITYKLPFYYSRGFIYDMEDQYRNTLPYDFTNVLQKVNNKWYYTFTNGKDNTDASILGCVRNSKIITSSIQNLFSNVVFVCESSDSRINNAVVSSSNNVIIDGISTIDGLQIKSCNNVNISVDDISNSELSLLTNILSEEGKSLTIDNSIISNLTNNTLKDDNYINRFIRTFSDIENSLKPVFAVNNFRVFDNTSTEVINSDFYNSSSSIASINTGEYTISTTTESVSLDRRTGHKSNDSWNHCRNSGTAQISFTITGSSEITDSIGNTRDKVYKLIENKYLDLGYIVVGTYYTYSDHNYSGSKYAPDIWYRFKPIITVTGAINGTIDISGKVDSELVRNASIGASYYRYFGFKPSIDISQLSLNGDSKLVTYNGQTYLKADGNITIYVTFNPEQIYVGSQNDAGGTKGVNPKLSDIFVYSNTSTTDNPMYTSYLKNGDRNTIYSCERRTTYSQLNPNKEKTIKTDIKASKGNITYGVEVSNDASNLLVAICQNGFVTKSAKNVYSLTEGISGNNNTGTRTVYKSLIGNTPTTTVVGYKL